MNEPLQGTTSIYLQIAKMIEDNILRKIYLEEEQVPSTNEMARVFGINPATAAKGINMLTDKGILYKKRGIGMFVAQGADLQIKGERKAAFYEGFVKGLVKEANSLEISTQELIDMIAAANKGE